MRALDTNPTQATVEKLGGTKKKGFKFFTFEEFLSIYSQVKKDIKNQGSYEDFIECLKLEDKHENGQMLVAELMHTLTTTGLACLIEFIKQKNDLSFLIIGEALKLNELEIIMKDCLGEPDENGLIEYTRKFIFCPKNSTKYKRGS